MIECDFCHKENVLIIKLELISDHCNYEIQDTKKICIDCIKKSNFIMNTKEIFKDFIEILLEVGKSEN